jgi:mono/diheme cytochrome c family protein
MLWGGWFLMCLAAMPLPAQNPAPDVPTLVFDAETKHYDAAPGEAIALFTFNLTNVWTNEVIISRVRTSCGCTTANLPATPWHLAPGATGEVHAEVRLAGKMGRITKTVTFDTSVGSRVVSLEVKIPPPPAIGGSLPEAERQAAMTKAKADPQAIFKGDCAACHVERGRSKFGQDLYAADCGVCHESSHRASEVPDLHALKQATDLDYWKSIITLGKPHTMMPAFAKEQGGPLSDDQIASLATYLEHTISHHFTPSMTNAAAPIDHAIASK